MHNQWVASVLVTLPVLQADIACPVGTAMVERVSFCASCHCLATWHGCAEGYLQASAPIRWLAGNLAEGFCNARQHSRQAGEFNNLAMVWSQFQVRDLQV